MSELQQQFAVIRWAHLIGIHEFKISVNGKFPIYAINNNSVNRVVGKQKKDAGVLKGMPDLCIPIPSSGFFGLYIEMKDGKKKPKPDQQACIDFLASQGYKSCVCYSARHAVETIREYLKA